MFPPTFVWTKKITPCFDLGNNTELMKKYLEPFWISQTRYSFIVAKLGMIASGKWSLKYKQTPLLCKLEGWSQRKILYPSIDSPGSSDEIRESKKVSIRQKISILWTFKTTEICESLEKSYTKILFKFQWQTDKELLHPPDPGVASVYHDCMMIQ